jgi:hypothetical protein
MKSSTLFFTQVSGAEQLPKARLLIDSIRQFGGAMGDCPIWIFEAQPEKTPCGELAGENVEIKSLEVPESVAGYILAAKVFACYQAEKLVNPGIKNLVWLATDCFIVQAPLLFDLGNRYDLALRPVHHQNIGLTAAESLDGYWKRIYREVGLNDVSSTVESYVDQQQLRSYYNTHMMSVNPTLRLFQKWFDLYELLVTDPKFQSESCSDLPHKIFLHQAPLSALISAGIPLDRIRELPPDYSYPYNLQDSIAEDRQARLMNDLTCLTVEERSLHPDQVQDINIEEPLSGWLKEHLL